VHRLRHRAKHLAYAGSLSAANAEGSDHAVGVEIEQLGGANDATKDAKGTGDVPAGIVVPRVYGHAEAAAHFDSQGYRGKKAAPGAAAVFRYREGSGDGWR
jgi:hypothetical protein